ncbi:MAG: mercuric reductase [Myxococcales bacterium]|nr:mercuric reductase [Myxococcales bacterium]
MTGNGQLLPHDEANTKLLANVHPADWRAPVPADRYHLVVVGAGTAGLIAAGFAAGAGARVALVERHLLGGDCLNAGCVPSKALIRSARAASAVRAAGDFGVRVPEGTRTDFGAVMRRMRELRTRISAHDSARRYRDEFGVDVFFGEASFTTPGEIEVEGRALRFRRAVIATGTRPGLPPIPGLAEARALTNESLFELTECPARLAVIGAGPIGCEMAQSFRRFGSEVTLFDSASQILIREDRDATDLVQRVLEADGVRLRLGSTIDRVDGSGVEKQVAFRDGQGRRQMLRVDEILVAAGRVPNLEGLGLERAGVECDAGGVRVDDRLRTTNSRIYAAGDVCLETRFTHAAEASARIAVRNALFLGRKRVSALVMPWTTYTDPELAHVGLSEREAERRGIAITTYRIPLDSIDRALLAGEDEGFAKLHLRRGSDRIVGATLVSRNAGELVSQVTLAMTAGIGLSKLFDVIYPYPTTAEVIKRTAGAHLRTRLTPRAAKLLALWLRLRR